jgi:signal transduction histidine kinase
MERIHTARVFMVISLGLLGVFLYLWLIQNYEREYSNLEKEVNFVFTNVVRDVQEELFYFTLPNIIRQDEARIRADVRMKVGEEADSNIIIQMPEVGQIEEKQSTFSLRIVRDVHPDSLTSDWHFKEGSQKVRKRIEQDSTIEVFIQSEKDGSRSKELFGSLSMLVFLGDSTTLASEGSGQFGDNSLFPLMKQKLDSASMGTSLPRPIQVITSRDSADKSEKNIFFSKPYEDVITGERIRMGIPGYRRYLLSKMWPQFLFSILLLSSIMLSFTLVYKALLKQRRLTALKNEFISNITHELKTPITTVGVAIEALQDFQALQDPEKTREYLDISRQELNRLSMMVDKVLKMSLFEQKEPIIKPELLDLGELSSNILKTMQLQFEKESAQVHFDQQGELFPLEADRIHLTSVLYNLIDNALKYSSGKPEIKISLRTEGKKVIFSIRDKGVGIPSEYQQKIFDKFFRVPAGNTHNTKGHGLGLAYVAGVIGKHGGSIEVESTEGEGSVFTVKLPAKG